MKSYFQSVAGNIRAQSHCKHRWGLSWVELSGELEHQLVCQRTHTSHKATETGRDTWMGHPAPPIRHSAGSRAALGIEAPVLTCSTSRLNYKWINRAADTETMKRRETEVHRVCILIFFLMTIPATHLSPNRHQSTPRVCVCVCALDTDVQIFCT